MLTTLSCFSSDTNEECPSNEESTEDNPTACKQNFMFCNYNREWHQKHSDPDKLIKIRNIIFNNWYILEPNEIETIFKKYIDEVLEIETYLSKLINNKNQVKKNPSNSKIIANELILSFPKEKIKELNSLSKTFKYIEIKPKKYKLFFVFFKKKFKEDKIKNIIKEYKNTSEYFFINQSESLYKLK